MTGDLTFSSQITKQIELDEGFRSKPYKDTVGKLTIGYGRNLDAQGISQKEAEWMLWNDIDEVQAKIRTQLPWTLNLDDARLGVLVSMAFNLGFAGLLEFRQMLEALKVQNWTQAATEMESSRWAQQVGARAQRLILQVKTGVWQFNQ